MIKKSAFSNLTFKGFDIIESSSFRVYYYSVATLYTVLKQLVNMVTYCRPIFDILFPFEDKAGAKGGCQDEVCGYLRIGTAWGIICI